MDIGIAANVADVVHPTVLEDEMLGALPPTTASLLLSRAFGCLLVRVIWHGVLSSGLSIDGWTDGRLASKTDYIMDVCIPIPASYKFDVAQNPETSYSRLVFAAYSRQIVLRVETADRNNDMAIACNTVCASGDHGNRPHFFFI